MPVSEQQFRHRVTGDREKNVFDRWLSQGKSISDVSFEPKGPDGDDDYIVISFDKDPNASSLTLPTSLRADAET